jgi:hypothetical protein
MSVGLLRFVFRGTLGGGVLGLDGWVDILHTEKSKLLRQRGHTWAWGVLGGIERNSFWRWSQSDLPFVSQSNGSRRSCTCSSICLRRELRSEDYGILPAVILPFVPYCNHVHEMHTANPSLKILSNASRKSHSTSS